MSLSVTNKPTGCVLRRSENRGVFEWRTTIPERICMMLNSHLKKETNDSFPLVTQSSTLPSRRVSLCETRDYPGNPERRTRSPLQVGDTAEWNSALLRSVKGSAAWILAFTLLLPVLSRVSAAESNHSDSSREKERQPIAIIQSTAPPQDKAIPCKQLAVYGTKDAVPALAALLSNDELA